MIKCIAFDFGGVLFSHSKTSLMKRMGDALNISEELVEKAWDYKIHDIERGQITEEEFWNAFSNIAKIKLTNKEFCNIYNKIYMDHFKPIKETFDLVKRLKKKGYKIGMISNHAKWICYSEEKYPFKHIFDPLLVSYEAGTRKPEKEIFELFIKESGLKAKEIVFIDDLESHKLPAEKIGMKFIQYKNPEQVEKELRKMGVDV